MDTNKVSNIFKYLLFTVLLFHAFRTSLSLKGFKSFSILQINTSFLFTVSLFM